MNTIPGAASIVIWEATTGVVDEPPFSLTGSVLTTERVLPYGPANRDFNGRNTEYYDVFLSDSNSVANPDGACVTINGSYTASVGFNIARVDLVDGSNTVIRSFDFLAGFTPGATGYVAASENFIVDNNLTTWSNLGTTNATTPRMRATVCLRAATLTFQKQVVSPRPHYLPGDQVAFSITPVLSNSGMTAGQTVTITDTIPAGLTFTGSTGNNWSCQPIGQTLDCTFIAPSGGIGAGALNTLTLDFAINAPQPSGVLTNCATLSAAPSLSVLVPSPQSCADIQLRNAMPYHHYAVKYVCGVNDPSSEDQTRTVIADGAYYTEINILNPDSSDVDLKKRVTPLVRFGEEATREPEFVDWQGQEDFTLPTITGTMDDCRKLGDMMNGGDLATQNISIGFLSIYASGPIDVTVVYTARSLTEDSKPQIEVEQIRGRSVTLIE